MILRGEMTVKGHRFLLQFWIRELGQKSCISLKMKLCEDDAVKGVVWSVMHPTCQHGQHPTLFLHSCGHPVCHSFSTQLQTKCSHSPTSPSCCLPFSTSVLSDLAVRPIPSPPTASLCGTCLLVSWPYSALSQKQLLAVMNLFKSKVETVFWVVLVPLQLSSSVFSVSRRRVQGSLPISHGRVQSGFQAEVKICK